MNLSQAIGSDDDKTYISTDHVQNLGGQVWQIRGHAGVGIAWGQRHIMAAMLVSGPLDKC